jgi:hypothetical protein
MAYQTIGINIAGPSYQSRSNQLASMQTLNWYQEQNTGAKDEFSLMPFPGLVSRSINAGRDRGMHQMIEIGYRVSGTTLYSFDKDGATTSIGSVPGAGRCILADDGINLFIVTEKQVYQYDSVAGTITNVTSGNIGSPNAVAFLNDKFIYDRGQGNDFAVSSVGDGADIPIENIAGAISDPDNLLLPYTFRQSIFFYGARSIETWYDAGTGSPPVARIEQQIFPVGLGAVYSVSSNDNAMYFLGDDRQVYQFTGSPPVRMSSIAISNAIESYETVSDAIGWCCTFQGQNFYIITFPTENKTWCLSETFGKDGWFEISSGTNGAKYQATSYVYVYGKHWLADDSTGDLYEWKFDNYQNNLEPIQRRRVLPPITGDLLGKKGARIQMSRLELIVEKGVGLITGQGEDPRIMIETSFDGHEFGAGTWARIGRQGEFVLKVELNQLKSFYEMMIRITFTDPCFCSLHGAAIDLKLAGR